MILTLLVVGVAVATPVYFLLRFVRAYERRNAPLSASNSLVQTVQALEAEVAELRTEVAQLKDGQEFTRQLLAPDIRARGTMPQTNNHKST